MSAFDWRGRAPRAGLVFLILAVVGNVLQGSTPALHGDPGAVAEFYNDKATAIALGMMLSLISVFFLAWFLAALAPTFGSQKALMAGSAHWLGEAA